MNRRHFVSSLAVAGAAVATSSSRLFAADTKAAPRVGLIGCGWYAGVNYSALVRNAPVEVVSLCDPNQHALQKTIALASRTKRRRRKPLPTIARCSRPRRSIS